MYINSENGKNSQGSSQYIYEKFKYIITLLKTFQIT